MPVDRDDQALVFAAKNGNTICFEELYRRYYDKIYALARTTVKNEADAEDVLQLTFIKAWQNLKTLEDPAAFSTWIQRITLRESYSLLRKSKPELSVDDESEDGELMQLESDLMLPEQYAERSDLSARLRRIINELSDVQRQTVLLFYYNEMTVEEIAAAMDCSEGTVKSRLYLARKALKTEIEEQERKSGQKFFGVSGLGLLPFRSIYVRLTRSTVVPPARAFEILNEITRSLFGTVAKSAAAGAQAAVRVQSATVGAVSGSATGTAATVASSAAKASIPLWAKITAGIAAASLVVTGSTVGLKHVLGKQADTAAATLPAIVESHIAPEPESAPALTEVDPNTLPDSLKDFLNDFTWGYRDAQDRKEYDCADLTNCRSVLASRIACTDPCVPLSLCPGGGVEEHRNEQDPLGRYESASYLSFGEDTVLWAMENVLNLSREDAEDCLQAALDSDESLYRYEKDGQPRLCNVMGDPFGWSYAIRYLTVKTEGSRYYLVFQANLEGDIWDTYYTELEEKTTNGLTYWSVYRFSETIPDPDRADAPEEEETAPQLVPVDPSTLPESLTYFLETFNWGYRDGQLGKEFDCTDPDSCRNYLASEIACHGACVSASLYPGGNVEEHWEDPDPLGRYPLESYVSFSRENVLWILKNVFNIDDAEGFVQTALDSDTYLYLWEENGEERLINILGGIGGPTYEITYRTVRTDGERYYLIYEASIAGSLEGVFYTELEQKTTDGVTYWSMYRHSASIPNLNDLRIPAGYDEAYRSYVQVLTDRYDNIANTGFNDNYHNAALVDVYGDALPELIFWQTAEEPESYSSQQLCIMTYEDHDLKTLWQGSPMGLISNYALFQANGEKRLYLLDFQVVVDDGHTIVTSFDEADGTLQRIERLYFNANYNMTDMSDVHYDYVWRVNEADTDEETFQSALDDLLQNTDQVIMWFNSWGVIPGNDRLQMLNNRALTVDEALELLYRMLGEEAPVESEDEIFRRFAGEYSFHGDMGFWNTTLTLEADGTFSAVFSDRDYVGGDGYEYTVYECSLTGRMTEARRINHYTYAFTVDQVEFVHEPGTEELREWHGEKAMYQYYDSQMLTSGPVTIYAYTDTTPVRQLPEVCSKLVKLRLDNREDDRLTCCRLLYLDGISYCWFGSEE